jgi:hypothetical protein
MKQIGRILWDAYLHALERLIGESNACESMSIDPETLMEEVRQEALEYLRARGYSVGGNGSSFLMVCCNCKKVRDGGNKWQDFEDYMAEHSSVEITHGLCAECVDELLPKRKARRARGTRQGKKA